MPTQNRPVDTAGVGERPLFFDGTLTLEHAGHTLTLNGTGRRLMLDVPGVKALRALAASVPRTGGGGGLPDLTRALRHHDLEVVLRLRGETVVTLGPDAEPGVIERALSLRGIDVDLRGLVRALFKQRR